MISFRVVSIALTSAVKIEMLTISFVYRFIHFDRISCSGLFVFYPLVYICLYPSFDHISANLLLYMLSAVSDVFLLSFIISKFIIGDVRVHGGVLGVFTFIVRSCCIPMF